MRAQVAQFLWVGPGLSPLESTCLRSFVNTGYQVHLYHYAELKNIPDGVILMDANEILPASEIFKGAGGKGGSFAPFADRFRYHLLSKRGGWWFDTDHISIQMLPEPTDFQVSSQWEGLPRDYPNVGAIWCKPDDPHVTWLRDQCDLLLESDEKLEYTQLGPQLMNRLIDEFGLRNHVAPWWEFCPYPYQLLERIAFTSDAEWVKDRAKAGYHRIKQMIIPEFRAAYLRKGTRAVHLWNEIWRVKGLSKDKLYHAGSLYGRLQRENQFIENFGRNAKVP